MKFRFRFMIVNIDRIKQQSVNNKIIADGNKSLIKTESENLLMYIIMFTCITVNSIKKQYTVIRNERKTRSVNYYYYEKYELLMLSNISYENTQ